MEASEANYKHRKENASFWYQKSVSLYASASLLWNAMSSPEDREFLKNLDLNTEFSVSIGCEHPYLMLFGLSYEVMLKAICIQNHYSFPQVGHEIHTLAKNAGLSLSEKENTQLRLLSQFIAWEGRYPTPKKHEIMSQHWNSSRKALWKTEDICGVKGTSRTDIFEYEELKKLWLKLSDTYSKIQT